MTKLWKLLVELKVVGKFLINKRMILLVWKHGEKFAGEGAECKLCKKVYPAKQGSTRNLINLIMY